MVDMNRGPLLSDMIGNNRKMLMAGTALPSRDLGTYLHR